jgi:hypothetical protein
VAKAAFRTGVLVLCCRSLLYLSLFTSHERVEAMAEFLAFTYLGLCGHATAGTLLLRDIFLVPAVLAYFDDTVYTFLSDRVVFTSYW